MSNMNNRKKCDSEFFFRQVMKRALLEDEVLSSIGFGNLRIAVEVHPNPPPEEAK